MEPTATTRPLRSDTSPPAQGWRWRYGDEAGDPVVTSYRASPVFSSQADAESWVGEYWRELVAAGVDSVTLVVDDRVVYGPMSLHPVVLR